MRNPSASYRIILFTSIALLLTLILASGWGTVSSVSAQVPAAETTVTEQPTATPTNTPLPTSTPTNTPVITPTNTPLGPTDTPTRIATLPPDTPVPSGPVPIPEPVTVVLFGTGLAALSAAVASRRKKEE